VLGIPRIRFSTRRLAVLAELFRGFPQSFKENSIKFTNHNHIGRYVTQILIKLHQINHTPNLFCPVIVEKMNTTFNVSWKCLGPLQFIVHSIFKCVAS